MNGSVLRRRAGVLFVFGAWSAIAAAETPGRERQKLVLERHYAPPDALTGRYQYVPFEVPAGVTRIDLEYSYEKAGGANAIDLGLLEPGPLDLGTAALRGWSGGERGTIFVGVDDASPGYWPGPLPPGRWHVLLGLYKIAESRVDVRVTVTFSRAARGATPALAARPVEPLRRDRGWWSGALHAHTVHSDGKLTAQQLADRARAEGLDFLAITDHNNTAHQRDRIDVPGLLLIVGEEVTTPGGHLSVWGLSGVRDFVDFRVLPGAFGLQPLVDAARARGALVSINHPYSDCLGCSWTHDVPQRLDAIEISNPQHANVTLALALWDILLREGRRVTAVGSSDWHRGDLPVGAASVRVWADELSEDAILASIREGRVVVMADAGTPPPSLSVRAGDEMARVGGSLNVKPGTPLEIEISADSPAYLGGRVDLVWRGEQIASSPLVEKQPARFRRWAIDDGYVRAHVSRADGSLLAVTNPIFVRIAPP